MADFVTQHAQAEIRTLIASPDLSAEAKQKLETVDKILATPLQTDVWIYRGVVFVLGAVVLLTVWGGIRLEFASSEAAVKTLPQAIVSIGSAAIGALAGLLAPSPTGR